MEKNIPDIAGKRPEAIWRAACKHCGLCSPSENEKGFYCLYYTCELPNTDAEDIDTPLRRQCRMDGNHFIWPVKGITPLELVRLKIDAEKPLFSRHTAIASLWLSTMGFLVSVVSLLSSAHIFGAK